MTPRAPIRTCVGCRQEGAKDSLARLVRGPDGTIHLDPAGRAPGRGAYLHLNEACFAQARRRKTLERALKGHVPDTLWNAIPVAEPLHPPAGGGLGGGPPKPSPPPPP